MPGQNLFVDRAARILRTCAARGNENRAPPDRPAAAP